MDEAPKLSMASIAGWVKRWVDSLFLRKTGNQTFTGTLTAVSGAAGRPAFVAKAAASPTVPVFEVEDSSGNTSIAIGANQDIQARSVMALRATSGASLAADGVLDTGYGYALVYVYSSTMGRGALFRIDVDGSAMISGSSSHFTGTADTASRVNVYYSGSTIKVQNKNATSRNVRVWMMTA